MRTGQERLAYIERLESENARLEREATAARDEAMRERRLREQAEEENGCRRHKNPPVVLDALCRGCYRERNRLDGLPLTDPRDDAYLADCSSCGAELK